MANQQRTCEATYTEAGDEQVSSSKGPITRSDLETAFSGLVSDGQDSVAEAGVKAAGIAGAFGFLALAVTYVIGRRKGRRSRTVVEVRRI